MHLSYSDYYGAYNRWLLFDSRVFWWVVSCVMSPCRLPRCLCDASSVWRYRGSDDVRCWWMTVIRDSSQRLLCDNPRLRELGLWVIDRCGCVCQSSILAVCSMRQRSLCASRRPHLVLPWLVCSRFPGCVCYSRWVCVNECFEFNWVCLDWKRSFDTCIFLQWRQLIRVEMWLLLECSRNTFCILYICI